MKFLFSILVLLGGSLSYADLPFLEHLTCGGKGFALKADVLANVLNNSRLTNIQMQVGVRRLSFVTKDGQLDQGHIWNYVYNFDGIEFGVEYNFAQKSNRPIMAYFIVPPSNGPFSLVCKVAAP